MALRASPGSERTILVILCRLASRAPLSSFWMPQAALWSALSTLTDKYGLSPKNNSYYTYTDAVFLLGLMGKALRVDL